MQGPSSAVGWEPDASGVIGCPFPLPTTPAAELKRLKYTGTAISAYDEQPIVSSGAVGLGCGFGYVAEDFQVRPRAKPPACGRK